MLTSAGAGAHDPSAYGGLFRSRDLGGTWLNADVGLFLNAALTVAVDPRDPAHLLMGTDLGLLRSRSGGRSWTPEGQGQIIGAVFALAFSPDGQSALCAAPSGVFRFQDGEWTSADAPRRRHTGARGCERRCAWPRLPAGAGPAVRERRRRTELSTGWRRRCREGAEITALAVATRAEEVLLAVIDGTVMASEDGGKAWRAPRRGPGRCPDRHGRARPRVAAPGLGGGGGPHPSSATIWA